MTVRALLPLATRRLEATFHQGADEDLVVDLLKEGPPLPVHEQTKISFNFSDLPPGSIVTFGDYEVVPDSAVIILQPFKNTIGLIKVSLEIDGAGQRARAFNVFGSKATIDRAQQFLRYLKRDAEEIAMLCFASAQQQTDSKSSNLDLINKKLIAGTRCLQYMVQELNRFRADPVFQPSPDIEIKAYRQGSNIGYEAVTYLAQNPQALSRSLCQHRDFSLHGRDYKIDQIMEQTISKKTDVYENRVIHAFLQHFGRFLADAEKAVKNKRHVNRKTIIEMGNEYFSFEEMLEDSGMILSVHSERIKKEKRRRQEVQQQLSQVLPITSLAGALGRPAPTRRVIGKPHYMALYRLLHEYHSIGEPEWAGTMDFFGLRSLPKVYELVGLVQILSTLQTKLGWEITNKTYRDFTNQGEPEVQRPINEPFNHFTLEKDDSTVHVYYEPILSSISGMANTTLGVVDAKHGGGNYTWNPDYLLRVVRPGQPEDVHIMDAKYSNYHNVTQGYQRELSFLQSCAIKYVMGIQKINDNQLQGSVDSMHLIYSDENAPNYYSAHGRLCALINQEGNINRGHVAWPAIGALPVHPGYTAGLQATMHALISER